MTVIMYENKNYRLCNSTKHNVRHSVTYGLLICKKRCNLKELYSFSETIYTIVYAHGKKVLGMVHNNPPKRGVQL